MQALTMRDLRVGTCPIPTTQAEETRSTEATNTQATTTARHREQHKHVNTVTHVIIKTLHWRPHLKTHTLENIGIYALSLPELCAVGFQQRHEITHGHIT